MSNSLGEVFFKTAPIEIQKATATSPEVWKAVLSSTSVDYDGERMSRKALGMAAQDLLHNSTVFFNHKHHELPVAKFVNTAVVDNSDGSLLVVEIVPSTAKGVEDVVTQVREGILKCMSIGGKTLKSFDQVEKSADGSEKKIRILDEIKALEGSIVGIGANPDAMMLSVAKSYFLDSLKDHVAGEGMETHASKASAEEYVDDYRHEGKSSGSVKVDMSGGSGKPPEVPAGKVPSKKGKDGKKEADGDSMDSIKCEKCGYEMTLEKKCGKDMKEEDEEEDEEEEKKKKGRKDVEVDVEKENGPSTPNKPELGPQDAEDSSGSAKKPKVKKPAVPDQSGALDGKPELKSVEVEALVKEVSELKKSLDEMKEAVYTRKGVVEAVEVKAPADNKFEQYKQAIFKAMQVEE